jgi:hypothetical protein
MRYSDYVPMFTRSENDHVKPMCTSCQRFVHKVSMDKHVEEEHHHAEEMGLVIKVNDQWWRKRGY